MLDWVTGASRSQPTNDYDAEEAPETPAHIFAARAFKHLLFGTPAPPDMTTEKSKRFSRLSNLANSPRRHSTEELARPILLPRHSDPMASPSKGILVAPGSVSTKRKSVTFGGLQRDPEISQDANEKTRPVSMDDMVIPKLVPSKPLQAPQDLRRTLFQQRESSPGIASVEEKQPVELGKTTRDLEKKRMTSEVPAAVQIAQPQTIPARQSSNPAEDQTVDLNAPRSTSGQHWKREYERDHDNSKAEMKKLIQYNQMTKSYAEKRDRDAIIMTQKADDAEAKAKSLEKQITKLTAQLMDVNTNGEQQDTILGKVAAKTAERLKYTSRADRYRKAVSKNESLQSSINGDETPMSSKRSSISFDHELGTLKAAADKAEARALRFESENASLQAMLQQMKKEKAEQDREYDDLHNKYKKKEDRLKEDNKKLAADLRTAKSQNLSLAEELRLLKESTRANHKIQPSKDQLFDLTHSRLDRELSPPTSDEELRAKLSLSRRDQSATMPQMDFTLRKDKESKQSKLVFDNSRRRSYAGETSDSFSVLEDTRLCPATRDLQQPYRRSTEPAHKSEESIHQGPPTDMTSVRKSSPLMKSFIDNLGTRRALPPERIAAAKKRLEEKAADRRATPGYKQALNECWNTTRE